MEKTEFDGDQWELMAHLITMLDRMVERQTYAEIFDVAPNAEWEEKMNDAAQSLAEIFLDRE